MFSVQALCNSILKRSFEEKIDVTPMKLQKLLYFIYRDYLKEEKTPLFSESFLAWEYGPVLRSVYDEFKSFGASGITKFARTANDEVYVINEKYYPKVKKHIDRVWGKYKHYNGIELSQKTHETGGAWKKAYMKNMPELRDEDIKNDNIE